MFVGCGKCSSLDTSSDVTPKSLGHILQTRCASCHLLYSLGLQRRIFSADIRRVANCDCMFWYSRPSQPHPRASSRGLSPLFCQRIIGCNWEARSSLHSRNHSTEPKTESTSKAHSSLLSRVFPSEAAQNPVPYNPCENSPSGLTHPSTQSSS